ELRRNLRAHGRRRLGAQDACATGVYAPALATAGTPAHLIMTAMRDPIDSSLPEWVGEALREPVTSHASSRTRIMDAVRGLPAPRRMAAPMRPSRWLRRG